MDYLRGSTVVHPRHGLATVEGTVRKDTGRGPESFLSLHVVASALRILVPERSLRDVGVREVTTRTQAEAILAVLQAPSEVSAMWSERKTLTASRMSSVDLAEKAMVVRDLTRHELRTGKALTMAESRSFDSCLDTLAEELSLALEVSKEEAAALVVERSRLEEASETVASKTVDTVA